MAITVNLDHVEAVPTDLLAAALRYATQDEWHVFPCTPRGKRPLTDNGLNDATRNPDTIRAWWNRWPNANIGIALAPSHLCVIDVDGPEGIPAYHELNLPPTLTVTTGRGTHHYYAGNAPTAILAPKLDLRGDGAYVIAPPSIHETGVLYTADKTDVHTLTPLQTARLRKQARPEGAKAPPVADVIPSGERNQALASMAGTMRRRGMSQAEILAALTQANKDRCNPPLRSDEVEAIAASIGRYTPADQPKTTPPTTSAAWEPLDLVTLGDKPRVPPELGGLIYTNRRHLLSGESESGKSWLAFCIAADELNNNHGVVWVDLDYMGAQDILERLRQLGCTDQQIRDRFAFYQPEGPLTGGSLEAVTELIQRTDARLVVIDAFTGFCALHGLKPNDGIDIEAAYRLMQPLCDQGCAVIILDHVVKDPGSRGRYAAGSERKLSGADVAIGFTLIEHYGRGRTGRSRLTVHKDRPAQLTRPVAGIFTLTSSPLNHAVTWSIEEDHSHSDDGTWSPTGLMQSVSIYLEAQDRPAILGEINENVRGKDSYISKACTRLVQEGYAEESKGAKNARLFTSIQPYREASE